MKSKVVKTAKINDALKEDILKSMIASFKIEGIHISADSAAASLKRIETKRGK